MAISFLKYKSELVKAWKDVSDNSSDTNWAIFGYEGKTYELKVVETGDDLDELVDELSGSKIQYAYCKVIDPNTNLPKFVLINWVGEGAPAEKKGICARHTRDVANLLRGAHVTINARSDDDVEKSELEKKVSKASGANYSFHKEKAKPIPEPKPVASVYQKTLAAQEIHQQRQKKEQFWAKQQKDEEARLKAEKEQKKQERDKTEKERRDREAREASNRDRQMAERMKTVNEMKMKEKQEEDRRREEEKQKWEAQMADEDRFGQKKPHTGGKAAEAAAMVKQRENDPRKMFEQRAAAPPSQPAARPPPRKLRQAPPGAPEPAPPPEPVRSPTIRPAAAPPPPPPAAEPEPEPEPEDLYDEAEPTPPPPAAATMATPPPPAPYRQDSDEEEAAADEDWGEEEQTGYNVPQPEPPEPVYEEEPAYQPEPEPAYQQEPEYELEPEPAQQPEPEPAYEPESAYDEAQPAPPPMEESEYSEVGGSDVSELQARALYDYQASDDTEISFDPGDIITQVEKIDDGWWQGVGPDGSYGMFPANYVEEI
ncbi:drebrin-like protein B [Ptychodera flava]|uniref:drebrin-like protein B n=1 Tax=Ptychodera flava TaxID=63121 RepID=UPI00396A21BD